MSNAETRKGRKPRRNVWWLSWVQPTPDYRPVTDPPNAGVLGWWCTGFDSEDSAILCAAVIGKNENDAKDKVIEDWPEAETSTWRFCEPMEHPYKLSDRFPLDGWAKERFKQERGK